jgi:hypothetical protein
MKIKSKVSMIHQWATRWFSVSFSPTVLRSFMRNTNQCGVRTSRQHHVHSPWKEVCRLGPDYGKPKPDPFRQLIRSSMRGFMLGQSVMIVTCACLLLGGCISSSQLSGVYATEHTKGETISEALIDLESSTCKEISYNFMGEKVDGYRTVITMRSKVDFPLMVSAKVDSPDSIRFASVWHNVEQRLEPWQSCKVISVLIKPNFSNRKVDYKWATRATPGGD